MAPPSHAPAALGNGAHLRLVNNIKSVLAGLLLLISSIVPSLAQTEQPGIFENLPVLQVNTNANQITGTLGDIDALNGKLDDAIAKSAASIDSYGAAINDAAANFSQTASNRVEEAEMECLRTCAEGLRLFVANGPKAMSLHQSITQKGDKVAALLGSRLDTKVKAAEQLAKAHNIPIEVVEVDLTPSEMANLREWSLVSDEVRLTEGGNRLHVDRLKQIMASVAEDRVKLAAEGVNLTESIKRMEMLQRVVRRFADDAVAEQKYRQDAQEFHQESERFGGVTARYSHFRELGEQSIQPRSSGGSVSQGPQWSWPGLVV